MEGLSNTERLRYCALQNKAMADDVYKTMLLELRELERKQNRVLSSLSSEDMDAVCDFFSKCEEMNERILAIVCKSMKFSFET